MLSRESKQIWLKKQNRRFKIKLLHLHRPRTDVPRDACTDKQAMWRIICNVFFHGQLNFAMSPGFYVEQHRFFVDKVIV